MFDHVETPVDPDARRTPDRRRVWSRQGNDCRNHEHVGAELRDDRGERGQPGPRPGRVRRSRCRLLPRARRRGERGRHRSGRHRGLVAGVDVLGPGVLGPPGPQPRAVRHRRGVHEVVQRARRHPRPPDRPAGARTRSSRSTSSASSRPATRATSSSSAEAGCSTTPARRTASRAGSRRSPVTWSRRPRSKPTSRSNRCRFPTTRTRRGSSGTCSTRFPETKDAVGVFAGSIDTTKLVAARNKEALDTLGAKVVYDGTYNPVGETSWRPFIEAHAQRGREGPLLRRGSRRPLVVPHGSGERRHEVRLGRRRSEQLRPRGPRRGRRGRRRLHADRVLPVPRSRRSRRTTRRPSSTER